VKHEPEKRKEPSDMNPTPATSPAPSPGRRLPPGLDIALQAIAPEDWKNVDVTVCHSPTTRQLLHVIRFLDELLPDIGNAAFWVGGNRITGPEIEALRERWARAVAELVSMGVDVCRRMNRVATFQRHKKILVNFGHAALFEPKKPKAQPSRGPKKEPGAKASTPAGDPAQAVA
jgi:hypothetical protein